MVLHIATLLLPVPCSRSLFGVTGVMEFVEHLLGRAMALSGARIIAAHFHEAFLLFAFVWHNGFSG